uniref:Plant-specific domain TIGR01615 family protein n=1 Tax=Davidia involucrata TaxID=16924 RepID=A0A5B7AMD7_DAVIN
MDCGVCAPTGDLWLRLAGGDGGQQVGQIGLFSHESEHDLAVMVSDFLENGSGGTDSRYSSDSDSGFCDLAHLADKISCYKLSMDQYESDLLSVVNSLMLSINETDLHVANSGPCNASCIRFSLVKLLRLSGYEAAVCASRWQGSGKVPGGDHEYIDVVNYNDTGSCERLIIDIDFRSHFEIARAVKSYDRILNSLPVVYVGLLTKLKQFLQVMVEAARSSLKQNSMPLPPWRSLAYLQAKWHSPYQKQFNPNEEKSNSALSSEHKQCGGHLKRLQSSLQSEIEVERLLKPINSENNRRLKLERRRQTSFRNL